MPTTIQISDNVKILLDKMRIYKKETYNEVLEYLLEDNMSLNAKTIKEIEDAKKRVQSGKFVSQEEAKKRLGLWVTS